MASFMKTGVIINVFTNKETIQGGYSLPDNEIDKVQAISCICTV